MVIQSTSFCLRMGGRKWWPQWKSSKGGWVNGWMDGDREIDGLDR